MDLLDRDEMLMKIAEDSQPIFEENGWEYRGRIPDVFDIFANLSHLCITLDHNPDAEIACGRFTVLNKDGELTVVPDFEI